MSVTFTDNSAQYLNEFNSACNAALEAIGNQAVSHAKQTVAENRQSHTGGLLDINHKVQQDVCHIGTNTKYAIYHEMGTGIYIAGGRKTPWSYRDAEGEWHTTRGVNPLHFLKNSVANHMDEFKNIVIKFLKSG